MPAFGSLSLSLYTHTCLTHAHTRGCANFIRWSSPLRRRHRTMAANPVIWLGGNRAHTETTVLGARSTKKKNQQNRAPAFESRQITAKRSVSPRNLPDQLIGRSGLCPLDHIGLNISTGRAQGHFPKPLVEERSLLHKRTTIFPLCSTRSSRPCLRLR
jgi:hypothetical protein